MYAVALRPGSWPPSPGFEPWAILISSWSARARYVAVTPNRAEATCLIRASRRRPSGPAAYHAGSSPPSPVFAAPPARWIPIVSAWCASGERAPTLIAETTNLWAIDRALSTESTVTGGPIRRSRSSSRGVDGAPAGRDSAVRYRSSAPSSGGSPSTVGVAPDRSWISLAIRGAKRWASPSARNRANPGSGSRGSRPGMGAGSASAASRRRTIRSPRSSSVVRPGHAATVGKQRSITSGARSTVSTSAPPM